MKKYNILYVDPPWQYKDKCGSGNRGAGFKYPCTNINDLKQLPVSNLADKNAVLVMWVTWPMLPDALELIKAWGFDYKTCAFVWLKRNKNYFSTLARTLRGLFRQNKAMDINDDLTRILITEKEFQMGMGAAGTRSNTEFCLLAKRGSLPRLNAGISQILEAEAPETYLLPHTGVHSEKPAEIRDRIVDLFGDLPRVELFCRHNLVGWDTWGNEEGIHYTLDMEQYDGREIERVA